MKKIVCYLFILFLPTTMVCQVDQGTWFSDSTIQKTFINPAHSFKGKFVISLPSIFFNITQSGPKYDDIIGVNTEGNTTINLSNALNSAKSNNHYGTFLNVQSIGFGFKFGRSNFTLNHGIRLLGSISYPKEFLDLYANGNAQFIGQSISIGPRYQVSLFQELGLGYSYGNENFRVGARIKYLIGSEDVSVERDRIDLFTSEDIYQLEFNNNYLINSSSVLQLDDLSDITFEYDGLESLNFFSANNGFAFDVGAEFRFENNSVLSFSVSDIGKINWEENITNYLSSGEIVFEGVDIVDVIRDTSAILLIDSLYNVLDFKESNNNYSSKLPLKLHASYSHDLSPKVTLSYLYFLQSFNEKTTHVLGLNANFKLSKAFLLGANYLFHDGSFLNLGLQGVLTAGAFQLYASTGNVLSFINPKSASYTSGRIGVNLIF